MEAEEKPGVSVVLPTRNEPAVGTVIERLHRAMLDRHGHVAVEVIVIDDSDDPGTVRAADATGRRLRSQGLLVRTVHRSVGPDREGGLSTAVMRGVVEAQAPTVLVMDADGQHPPETAPAMLDCLETGSDIVVASRYVKGGSNEGLDGLWRKFVSLAATILTRLLFPQGLRGVTDPMTGFFAFRKDRINTEKLLKTSGFKILLALLAHHPDLKRAEVPLQFQQRLDGESKAGEGNGAAFLKQLPHLRLATMSPVMSFALGGALIALFGAALLGVLVYLGVSPVAANTTQLLVTLGLNFAYNRYVTWRGVSGRKLSHQMWLFAVTRGVTLALSWSAFVGLMALGTRYPIFSVWWQAQIANALCVIGAFVINYATSKHVVFASQTRSRHRNRHATVNRMLAAVLLLAVVVNGVALWRIGFTPWLMTATVLFSAFSLVTAILELNWRLYGRRSPEARLAMKFPPAVALEDASILFSAIVPALNEHLVIGGTLRQLLEQTHPRTEIIVSLSQGDDLTIAAVQSVADEHPGKVVLVVEAYAKSSKPQQLNAALPYCGGTFVAVFDAETMVEPEAFLHVEALINETGADVVQGGVQLVNLDLPPKKNNFWGRLGARLRGWFCVHNVMEYFFWFSSRMFKQVAQGFVPLGGNTVFIRRNVIDKIKWPLNLTEDCALGVKLSVEGYKIVAAYEPRLAAREETPSRIYGRGGLSRQRTRWVQGFLSVLLEGEWRKLPTFGQRMLALYTLAMPFVQALNGVMLPLAIIGAILLKAPVALVMFMFLPLVPMALTILTQVLGLREFSREFGQKARLRHYLSLILLALPYQIVLAWSAVIAVIRQIRGRQNWQKTAHVGAHL